MIPVIISTLALTAFLWWAIKHVGVPTSISSLFYVNKTQWTYTMVIGGIGALMTLVDAYSLIHYAGISLVLGTAAPHFKDENSLSKPLHYGFTALAVIFSIAYFTNFWIGLIAAAFLGGSKLLEKKIPNPVFWMELLFFYGVFLAILIKLSF